MSNEPQNTDSIQTCGNFLKQYMLMLPLFKLTSISEHLKNVLYEIIQMSEGYCCGILVQYVKIHCYNLFNKELNGQ